MNLILFGPPGAGKGTQGDLLARATGLRKLSTGDLLREAVRDGTALGAEAKRYMDAGELVPDQVILGLVKETLLGDRTAKGFILDGFPRTLPQARALDVMLAEIGQPVAAVLVLDVADQVIVQRLGGRRACPNCGAVYNDFSDPPKQAGTCDRCGSGLRQRTDDEPATVQRRLDVYHQQTAPILDYYQNGVTPVRRVAGDRSIDEVQDDLLRAIAS